jgi:hypothetical protein
LVSKWQGGAAEHQRPAKANRRNKKFFRRFLFLGHGGQIVSESFFTSSAIVQCWAAARRVNLAKVGR